MAGLSQYIGASLAVGLFVLASDLSVGWGRLAMAALVLLAWRRPWNYPSPGRAALFGLVLGAMNILFYLAIDRIALGTTVALEFLGPVLLAATARTKRAYIAIVFAVVGVFLISWVGVDLGAPGVAAGVFYALAAGGLWAVYMTMAKSVASTGHGIDGLAIGLAAAAVVYSPLGINLTLQNDPMFWLTLLGVGILSSVVPYAIDQFVLTDLPAPTFAILNAVLPAMSLAVGLVMLGQMPTIGELAGLIAISISVFIATYERHSDEPTDEVEVPPQA